ncbi:hypothetical protein MTO96_039171 [Rhipicephalus appendiculatus]
MADASKSAGTDQRPLDRAGVMVCAVLLVLVTPLVLWFFAGLVARAWPPVRTNRSERNCASATVHELGRHRQRERGPVSRLQPLRVFRPRADGQKRRAKGGVLQGRCQPDIAGTVVAAVSLA